MKKKILCWALTVLMLVCSMPLSVFAEELGDLAASLSQADAGDGLPTVSVTSLYEYGSDPIRARPDDGGIFYLDIALDWVPDEWKDDPQEIPVYYRTVDDTAVAQWGDYESVGDYEEVYVTLNQDNGYKKRVTVKSSVLENATFVDGDPQKIQSRRFLFQLTRVEGKAVLSEEAAKREVYCYLSAERYVDLRWMGVNDMFKNMATPPIKTEFIYGKGEVSRDLNFQFDDTMKNLVSSGEYDLGILVMGVCTETWYQNDGPTTLDLYYTYRGVKRKALTLKIEGEFDDSNFYGWEHAYNYVDGNYEAEEDLEYHHSRGWDKHIEYDIDDFMKDNFRGFILYDNDGNVACEVTGGEGDDYSVSAMVNSLKQSRVDRYALVPDNLVDSPIHNDVSSMSSRDLTYLRLPSNFALADSYSFTFGSDGESDEARKLDGVQILVRLIAKDDLKIAADESGNQLVTTNVNQLREGDPLRLTLRFNKFVRFEYRGSVKITAKINGSYEVTFRLKDGEYYEDTAVFECELPEELKGVEIKSIRDITLNESPVPRHSFQRLISRKIYDMYGLGRDMRVPVATVSDKYTENWLKSKPLDLYVNTLDNASARFNDFATVYYQWSDSPELPETYSQKIAFHTSADGEIMKTIIGSGNGAKYLHMKTVSVYGKSSISDRETRVYDPSDPNATYTPFGPYLLDNEPPALSDTPATVEGSLMNRVITIPLPADGGTGVRDISLYYVPRDSEDGTGVHLETRSFGSAEAVPPTVSFTVSHAEVGVGADAEGNVFFERAEIQLYWVITDHLGNTTDKIGAFKLVFDTNDYMSTEIEAVGPYHDTFIGATEQMADDQLSYIYDYKGSQGNLSVTESEQIYSYGFFFTIKDGAFGETDQGVYSATVKHKGVELTEGTDFILIKNGNRCVVWFLKEIASGRYDIQLIRTEGESRRVSQTYGVYATNGQNDNTAVRDQIDRGTLLSNTVYQLSTQYPYFYYKDAGGVRQQEYYNGIRQPATFSGYAKAKEYVYFKELGDLYLVQLSADMAAALGNAENGVAGYLKADGETMAPQAGQYWVRYKSASWTPTAGDSAWVYYYYGADNRLSEASFSSNLRNALDTVATRITSYGREVILTDESLFLGSAMSEKMLDKNGMPYLLAEQIHYDAEEATATKSGMVWSSAVFYTGDRGIYNSKVALPKADGETFEEFPILGHFAIPEGSRFYYKTYAEYGEADSAWRYLPLEAGDSFFDALNTSSVYYVREISEDGVAVYGFYVDKEAPKVTFSHTSEAGTLDRIPIDGVELLDINSKDLFIGAVDEKEYDRLSYVAVYKVNNLSLVGIYTADMLDQESVKLEDGNYYIVVSDRSGNHYTVNARVSSNALECQVKETENKFIKLTCNRKADQILRYEVYLNGELVTSTYAAEQSFEAAGLYTIYIQDIYGNDFSKDYTFTRNYPSVTWKYFGEDGKYHAYDPTAVGVGGFVMTSVSDNQYKISTSVKTRFSFSGDYVYEFIGAEPRYNETLTTETVVTIEEGQSFTLRVSYRNHSNCYVTYSAIVDVTPPTINVQAEVDEVINGERALFDAWLRAGQTGDILALDDLYYLLSERGTRILESGGSVSSDIISIDASDANDLALVEVYLDGELLQSQNSETGFSRIVVGRWGSYRVLAKDTLDNVAEFTFTNGQPEGLGYFVDGVQKDVALHGYLNFETVDGKHVYTKVDYGNTEFRLDLRKNANVFLSVGRSDGNTEIHGFRIADGQIYPLTYQITTDNNGEPMVDLVAGAAILNVGTEGFRYGHEYAVTRDGSYAVYASMDENMMVSIKVYAPEDAAKIVSVSARVEFIGSHTVFVASEMSKKRSHVHFKEQGVQENTDIRANDGFTVDEQCFGSERIERIRLYYSKLNDLSVDALAGRADLYATDTVYADEGFYLLVVRNLYGNETVYKITVSRTFGITESVTFGDGHKVYYSRDYAEKLYSNGEITLDILSEDVTYRVTRNGEAYNGFVQKLEGGITYFVFSEAGTYEVTLTDSFGNVITRQLEIDKSAYTIPDGLLTGFNEKALKRAEGYTNQKLSINKAVYDTARIHYLAIRYGDALNVLYDAFAEEPVQMDEQAFIDAIGADGDGVYTLICRNRYGSVVTQDIHYRATPTLRLERTTRSHSEAALYDLNHALSLGFWSNNTLLFSTDATTYVFTVNGDVTECPLTLVFEHAGDYGSTEYDITYIDEYGFEYAFKAYLVRKEVTITVPDSITGIELDGILNTKNDISITFDEISYATYTINNGEEMIYRSGETLQKDGTYRFTVMDYAGNTAKLTIKKDTIVEFEFYESNTSAIIQNGGVVNSSKIGFRILNQDSARIEKVLIDGVLQTDFSGSKFTEDGKCEVLLCDDLGNKAYFCFYIITREQNGFAYTTPYEYRITELWYDNGDGVKVSYLNFVNHTDFNSDFNFTENGHYTVVMASGVTGSTSSFDFTVNTNPPEVTLEGCNPGDTTINDVTLVGYKVGDRIKIYRTTKTGEELIQDVEIMSMATQIPVISEGGAYRVVVESEAGVQIELSFVRKHVMNTAGSVFIMVIIGLAVIGLFTGLVYRNKSKTDD